MTFIWPLMLLSLLLIPLLIGVYLRLQRRRRQVAATLGTLGMIRAAAGRTLGRRRHVPPLIFLAGLTLLLVAMARPEAEISLPRLEGTIILAFDVSGSMAADDLKPTRMEAAKTAATEFVQRQPSTVRLGVVAFSESGFTVQPPTNDQDAILSTIARLRPERGTSLSAGILAALNTIFAKPPPSGAIYSNLTPTAEPSPTPMPKGTYAPAAIVLLTDGENTAPPAPFDSAQLAADRGVRIYPVGIGSAAGVNLKVEGFTVHTQLDEATLQQIAQITDGSYSNAQNEEELRAIYQKLSPELVVKEEKTEITALFAGASMLLLLIGGVFSMIWFGRVP